MEWDQQDPIIINNIRLRASNWDSVDLLLREDCSIGEVREVLLRRSVSGVRVVDGGQEEDEVGCEEMIMDRGESFLRRQKRLMVSNFPLLIRARFEVGRWEGRSRRDLLM